MKIVLILTCLFSLLSFPTSSFAVQKPHPKAPSKAEQGYYATYDVYAGGVHALQARLTYKKIGERYDVSLASETYGLLNRLVPWQGSFSTKGDNQKGLRQPEMYISDTTFRGDRALNTYNYGKNGQFAGFTRMQNGKPQPAPKDLDPSIAKDTTDMLSSTLEVMDQIANGKDCNHDSKIFDSERSFHLLFHDLGKEVLKKSDYNIYEGDAEFCTVEVKPDGGRWNKKPRGWMSIQEQGRKKGTMPTIWFANIGKGKDLPAVPVKVLLKTDYGTFFVHLTSFEEKPAK